MSNVERNIKQIDMREHIKKRAMWAGSKKSQTIEMYVVRTDKKEKSFQLTNLKFPPALFKIIDEIAVNAVDHYVVYPKEVTQIAFEVADGYITVYNNGPGIKIEELTSIKGVKMYSPQMIFSEFLAGSNLDDSETTERIVGGQNGLGSKITVVFSTEFSVETYDAKSKILYKQSFNDSMLSISAPELYRDKELSNHTILDKKGYTKIRFLPDYAEFGLDRKTFHKTLMQIVETRAWQIAAYTSIDVSFNGSKIILESFEDFCAMFAETEIVSCKMLSDVKPNDKYPWDICIGISDGKERQVSMVNGVFIPAGGTHIQYVQKILVEAFQSRIEKELKKLQIKFNKNLLLNNIFIFMKGSIPNPEFLSQTKDAISSPIERYAGYEIATSALNRIWSLLESTIMSVFLQRHTGDVKLRANRGKVDVPKYVEANYCRNVKRCLDCGLIITEGDSATGTVNAGLLSKHASPDTFNYDLFGTFNIQGVMINCLKESVEMGKTKSGKEKYIKAIEQKDKKTSKVGKTDKVSKVDKVGKVSKVDKDGKADKVSKADKPSKVNKVSKTKKNTVVNDASDEQSDTTNELDDTTELTDEQDDLTEQDDQDDLTEQDDQEQDEQSNPSAIGTYHSTIGKHIPNSKVKNNERITSLIKVLGLDFNKTYDFTERGEKEWQTLRYGYVAGLMDQDLDGFNIFGLLATFFMTFWPELIKRNFIRRINTPLIRMYPKNKKLTVKEFYSEKQAFNWITANGEENIKQQYVIKYYKGLATHDKNTGEVNQMFKHIDKKICTYVLDEHGINSMFVYYGNDTAPRKRVLSTPVTVEYIDSLKLPLSYHYERDTKMYQRDNIIRKLINAVDGFVVSRRKVFYTARKHGHGQIKVAGLASAVVSYANYHHGESSISETIIRMAQSEPGCRNLPLLVPNGNFGTREKGYKNAGASRYIHTHINYKLADKLFKKEDDYILPYELEDGERYEPKYYMPIIPYMLCESNEIPATGWKITVHARELADIFKNVRDRIKGATQQCGPLRMSTRGFNGTIRKVSDQYYFVGAYVFDSDENCVTITELPPGSYSEGYLKGTDEAIKKRKADKTTKRPGMLGKEYIDDYEDRTDSNGVYIKLYLKPGARDAIDAAYGDKNFSSFEEYFELKKPIHHCINLITDKGEVKSYSSYEEVFDDWYPKRKALYAVRTDREIILCKLELQMLANMQRFSREHKVLNISNKTTDVEADEIMLRNKYDKFNKSMLDNPKYAAIEEIYYLATEYSATWDYLLSLSYRDLSDTQYRKREERIAAIESRLKYLQDDQGGKLFKGAQTWLSELDELEEVIKKGQESNWLFGDDKWNFEDADDEPKPTTKTRTKVSKVKK